MAQVTIAAVSAREIILTGRVSQDGTVRSREAV